MQRFIAIRFLQMIFTLLAMSVIVFGLARLSGDPTDTLMPMEASFDDRERIREHWGLDRPVHIQYLTFIGNAMRGDFGESLQWPGRKALDLVLLRLKNTLELAAVAMVFALAVAVPIGVFSAAYKNSWIDFLGKLIALLGQSLPHFFIGIVFMWILAVQLNWLPTSGRGTFQHMIMPAIVIGWFQVAALMRLIRSAMLESLDSEYVKLAHIKGLPEHNVIWKHSFRNAIISPLTYFGVMISYLVIGSITTEVVFSWPGIGDLIVGAVRARDFQVVQAVAMVLAAVVIVINTVIDILYAYVDPRIRYE